MQTNLIRLAEVFGGIRDPRSKQGTNLPLSGILAVVFLGLLAGKIISLISNAGQKIIGEHFNPPSDSNETVRPSLPRCPETLPIFRSRNYKMPLRSFSRNSLKIKS